MFNHLIAAFVFLLATGCGAVHTPADGRVGPSADKVKKPAPITDADFQSMVLESEQVVLVDVWSARCSPCVEMKPVLRELVADFDGRATILQLDVDANPLTPETYAARKLPTFLIFRNGEVVKRLDGLRSKKELALAMNAAIASSQ